MKNKHNKIVFILLSILGVMGLVATLIYIFHSSTAILTSDSVITDVLSHQQRLNNEFFLKTWYYGNEFWIFSLAILTYILSFVIKNNILLRQVSVLITALLFFFLLLKYCKKTFKLKETLITIVIFLTGISYSVLDYFYAFNAYLTVVINSLFIIYMFYIVMIEENKKKSLLSILLIASLLINVGSLRYFPSLIVPLILTYITLILISSKHEKLKDIVSKNKNKFLLISIIFIISLAGLGIFLILTNVYHYEQRAGSMTLSILDGKILVKKVWAIIQCINNFFGFDNRNNAVTFMTGAQYFVSNHKDCSIFSILSFTIIIKFIMCLFVMIISPIVLFKNYKKNNKFINFLLIYNTYSWLFMIIMYIFTNNFFYNYSELKYFLLNIILNLFMSIYVFYNYIALNKVKTYIIDIFVLLYISSNLYTTYITISDNNTKAINKKYELVNVLKANDLYYGYGCFWSGLLTHFLSNYEITVASLEFRDYGLVNYKWYSDEKWYNRKSDKPVFLIIDNREKKNFDDYIEERYYNPDKIIKVNDFLIYVYNKDPFANVLE